MASFLSVFFIEKRGILAFQTNFFEPFRMNLAGTWHFKEDFGYGTDEGEMTVHQNGNRIFGSMVYREVIEGDDPFTVCVDFEGTVSGDRVKFVGTSYEIFDHDEDWIFNLEERTGNIISSDLIEGTSKDVDEIEGKFIMIRKK